MSVPPIGCKECWSIHFIDRTSVSKTSSELLATVTELLRKGFLTSNSLVRRKAYHEAFLLLKSSHYPELRPLLFRLLERYAVETYFCPVRDPQSVSEMPEDEEQNRFRRCASVMEVSLCLQLYDLGLVSPIDTFDLGSFSSLEELVLALEKDEAYTGLFFHQIALLTVDVDVLVAKAEERNLREKMAFALSYLTLSYQRICPRVGLDDQAIFFQKKLQAWTEALIGSQTREHTQQLADYRFKIGDFMLALQKASWKEKVAYYESLLASFEECYPANDVYLRTMRIQINEIIGTVILEQSGLSDADTHAEPYFQRAKEVSSRIWRHHPPLKKAL